MKGTIDFITGGTQMTLTYRYFPESDEFQLVRGIYWGGADIDPFTLHQLETAVPYAGQIRDLIYLDLCAWGARPKMLFVVAGEEIETQFGPRLTPAPVHRRLTPVTDWIDDHARANKAVVLSTPGNPVNPVFRPRNEYLWGTY